MRRLTPSPPALRALALGTVFASAAIGSTDYPSYLQRLGVSDFDQEWNGMWRENFGRYHCVPTSYADIFKYLDDNDLPDMSTIHHHSSSGYEDSIMSEITRLGNRMDTDPEAGTSSDDAFDYAVEHLAENAPGVLMYNYLYGPDWNWGTGRIRNALAAGSIIRIGYGRYYRSEVFGIPTWFRNGGHSVVCIGYDYTYPSEKWLMVNDPASGGDIYSQSPMLFEPKRTENITLFTFQYGEVTHARYTRTTGNNGEKRTMIDSMHQIMPLYAGWFETWVVERSAQATSSRSDAASQGDKGQGKYHGDGSVRVVVPWQPADQRGEIPKEFRFTPRENMVDWTLAMGELSAYYVTHLGRIFHVDLTTGEHKLLHVLKGAKSLLEGGSTLDLYVLVAGKKGDQIVKLERDANQMETFDLPGRAAAMDLDPLTGGPAVLSADLTEVYSLTEDFQRHATTKVPPIPSGMGDVIFRIDHLTGDILTTRKGAFEFNRFSRRLGSDIPMRQAPVLLSGITSLAPTENGLVAVQDGNVVQTYDRFGRLRGTQLSGLRAEGELKLTHSHKAAKAGQMVGDAWRNIWPVED